MCPFSVYQLFSFVFSLFKFHLSFLCLPIYSIYPFSVFQLIPFVSYVYQLIPFVFSLFTNWFVTEHRTKMTFATTCLQNALSFLCLPINSICPFSVFQLISFVFSLFTNLFYLSFLCLPTNSICLIRLPTYTICLFSVYQLVCYGAQNQNDLCDNMFTKWHCYCICFFSVYHLISFVYSLCTN